MAVYTVHLPDFGRQKPGPPQTWPVETTGSSAPAEALARAIFVRERFSWAAFFFGPLWLARHRLWLGLVIWVAVVFILDSVALRYVGAGLCIWIGFFLEVLLGLEGNDLRRSELARRGYRLLDVAAGRNRDDAERSFYRRYFESTAAHAPNPSGPPPLPFAPRPQDGVLGVFPLPEDGR